MLTLACAVRGSTSVGRLGDVSFLNGLNRLEGEMEAITEFRERCPLAKVCSLGFTGDMSGVPVKWSSQATLPVGREMLALEIFFRYLRFSFLYESMLLAEALLCMPSSKGLPGVSVDMADTGLSKEAMLEGVALLVLSE